MTPEERLYQEVKDALTQNDLPKARQLLTQLLKINRSNPEYWLLMSAVVETRKERGICLKEVLKLDPGNLTAIRGLRLLDEDIPDPEPPPGIRSLKQDWKTSLEIAAIKPAAAPKVRRKAIAWSILGVIALALVITGIILGLRPKTRPTTYTALKFSLTPPPTETAVITPSATFEGPPPLWTLLEATFTPTPLYVATPHNLTEAYRAAMKAYEKGEWAKALEYFKQVLGTEPNSPDIQYYIGECFRFLEQYKNAVAAYDAALKIDPAFAPAYLGKARVQLQANPPDANAAEKNLKKAVELDPLMHEAILELANASLAHGDADTALEWTSQLSSSMPRSSLVETIRAQAFLLQGEYKLALDAIEKANGYDVSSLPVYKMWAEILQANERYEDSLEPLNIYLTYSQGDTATDLMLAKAYFAAGEMEEALTTVNRALSSNSTLVDALVIRGNIYLHQEEIDLAEKDFDRALALQPKSFDANIGQIRIALLQDYPGLAFEYVKVAVELAKGDREEATALYWRAITLIELGEMNSAIRDLEAVLAFPEDILPDGLRQQAEEAYLPLVTPTPSLTPTETVTPSITPTPSKTSAVTLTPTLMSSRTPTRTPTR